MSIWVSIMQLSCVCVCVCVYTHTHIMYVRKDFGITSKILGLLPKDEVQFKVGVILMKLN